MAKVTDRIIFVWKEEDLERIYRDLYDDRDIIKPFEEVSQATWDRVVERFECMLEGFNPDFYDMGKWVIRGSENTAIDVPVVM